MTEGEVPPELIESITSAGAYEQEARREYQIAETASRLRIPSESLQNAAVHRYISVLRDLAAAHERLEWPEVEDVVAPHGSQREDHERQMRVLYLAGEMLLRDGLGTNRIDRSQLKHWFDGLARRYGAHVQYNHDEPEPEPATGALWTGRSSRERTAERPWRAAQGRLWWHRPDMPYERHDREHSAALAQEAVRQGLPDDVSPTDPVVHGLLSRLIHGRRLVAEMTALKGLPPAPGMTPPAPERLARVAPLARLAVAVLEEEFHPGRLSPSRVTGELNEAMRPYGLKIS